ncbi:MAG: hypothetical protein ABRQ37_19165 [Candidatus Eremiobacterota bacterium]
MADKLCSQLCNMLSDDEKILPVIVQVNDTIMEEDEKLIIQAGGTVKSKLSIINSYGVELTAKAIKDLIANPRIKKIYYDGEVQAI